MVLDATGDVYAGGWLDNIGVAKTFAVVKLNSTTGAVMWRTELHGTGVLYNTKVNALTLDQSGDVIAAGSIVESTRAEEFTVVKLDHTNGAVAWRTELSGQAANPGTRQDEALDVAVDSVDNVLAAGFLYNDGTTTDLSVAKLSGTTGRVTWTRSIDGAATSSSEPDVAWAVAVDSSNDVLVGGLLSNQDFGPTDYSVLKLAGDTGRVNWQRNLPRGELRALAVSGTRVVTTGNVSNNLTVAVFDSASGQPTGGVSLTGTARDSFNYGFDVTVGPDGRIVAAGSVSNVGNSSDFTMAKIN